MDLTVRQVLQRKQGKRCPYDHVRIKDFLTNHYKDVCPIDELISSLGVDDYSYEIIEEVPLNNLRIMDSIVLVKGTDSRTGERCSLSIGFELKRKPSDLKADNKIPKYLGYTDYFYIGVANNRHMLPLLERFDDEPRIGAVMFRKDWLIKTAQRQNIAEDNKLMEDQIILGRLNRCFRQKYVARMKSEKRAEKLEQYVSNTPLPDSNQS